ncbi:hypothetical protein K8W59_13850 [Nocardioides rotundus]|uniref:hypothetical protein n=1 Tax=Nocardioides rotundus TaxID=1774216 RepID=UPI001CBE3685|nr:hypothetical protein [Nocardioides rotundus]UAL28891.1 hypothetical protein K8W59_13850 [Nocardioides rotundus]
MAVGAGVALLLTACGQPGEGPLSLRQGDGGVSVTEGREGWVSFGAFLPCSADGSPIEITAVRPIAGDPVPVESEVWVRSLDGAAPTASTLGRLGRPFDGPVRVRRGCDSPPAV